MKLNDLSNTKIGTLQIVSRADNIDGRPAWNCLCDCGAKIIVSSAAFARKNAKYCNCQYLCKSDMRDIGGDRDHLYKVWGGMLRRCLNIKDHRYSSYGGRGINVCHAWLEFSNFFAWAKGLYTEGLQIDRVNNDSGYYPENCRFTTRSINICNRRKISSITGFTGVKIQGNRFIATVRNKELNSGKLTHVGSFLSIDEAVCARNKFIERRGLLNKLDTI